MRYATPILKSLAILWLARVLWFVAFDYDPTLRTWSPPLLIVLLDAVTLIIHEAGHFFFQVLGHTLYVMGGSIFQVLFPAGITIFVWRRWPAHTVWPLFWTGQSMCNAAIYIADAPVKRLHLIGRGLIHDWNHLATHLGFMDSAVSIAQWVHWIGVAVCLVALAHGIRWIVEDVRDKRLSGPDDTSWMTPDES